MRNFPKALVALLLCCCMLCGCSLIPDNLEPIVLTVEDLTITMPGYYENLVSSKNANLVEGFFLYGFSEIMVTGIREAYDLFEEVPTLEAYANKLITDNELNTQIEVIDGLTTFTYRQLDNGESYTYITAVFAGTDAFWMVHAGCTTLNFEVAKEKLMDILKTIEVK